MKSFTLTYLLTATIMMTGCQSFQFVESPIPVKNLPIKNIQVKTTTTMAPVAVLSNAE